jgi:hypothetical protein
MRKAQKQSWLRRHWLRYILLVCLLMIVVAGGVYLRHKHDEKYIKVTVVNTATPATSGSSQKSVVGGTGSSSGSSSSSSTGSGTSVNAGTGTSSTSSPATTSGTPPTAPSGTFVSNHKPGANGSPYAEQSTCNVQSGTSCTITFTSGGTTKSLPIQVAGSNGAVAWNWSPAGIGLTTGSWTITATATLNGQSTSTQDQTPLEVQ